ncbi:Hint domain-containing protein [Roseovarius arcticus]|uniref:Hint domain-containing protein n=1 Tax=Roseovarius arcticus TaxID=2547404 RepID=UPI0011104072|nr:Hint domain-containing protein [Roseovarius arcticus]
MVYTPSALGLTGAPRAEIGRTRGVARREVTNLRDALQTPVQECEIAYLLRDGSAREARHNVPALPVFEAAFSAFARGTLIATPRGPVAIEDLAPGMKVLTNERGPSPVLWIGTMSLRRSETAPEAPRLTRIMTGALGMGRPMTDLMTGPGARIAQRNPSQSGNVHSDLVLRPVRDLIDGTHVIELSPPGAVQLYHLALRRHATITAAGLAVETYHPGPGFQNQLTFRQLEQFIDLFPHVTHPADFGGLVHPRAPLGTGGRAVI